MRIALTIFLLLSFADVFAQEPANPIDKTQKELEEPPPCEPGPSTCSESDSGPYECKVSTVYKCANNSCGKDGGAIQQARESFTCKTITTSCSDGCSSSSVDNHYVIGGPFRTDVQEFSKADKYQTCSASGNNWQYTPPPYQCSGQCYPAPQVKKLDDNSFSPKNVFDSTKKPKLPINFEWENNVETTVEAESCQVDFYTYQVPGTTAQGTVNLPDRNVIVDPDECKLNPNSSYTFGVQACANNTCGATGTLPFATSNAPQPLTPYDPDWEDEKSASARFPAEFTWCEYPDPSVKSYALNFYELKKDGTRGKQVLLTGTSSKAKTEYFDSSLKGGLNQLGKGAPYLWEIGACSDSGAKQCGNFSQFWSLVPGGELKAPLQLFPASGAFVNMADALQWQGVVFATHYVVNIKGASLGKDFFTQNNQLSLGKIWKELALTTSYEWKVAPCGGAPMSQDIKDCKNDHGTIPWSNEQQFTTTGAKPLNLQIAPTEAGVAGIPLTLDWDAMGGAASYEIVVPPNPRIVSDKSETTLQYPLLKTKTPYSFAVKTCADKLGNVCGLEASGSFTTVTLASPPLTVPTLGQKEFDPSTHISWSAVFSGNFYSYILTFLSPSSQETSSECTKTHEVAGQITAENGATVRFRCLGNYTLSVQACVDADCKEAGGSTTSTLSVEKLLAPSGGLVPCDRGNDDARTVGVDERKPCGIEHIFLLIRNLIDFVLWKLTLIIVVLMATATGAMIFFSFGGPDVMTKVRSLWKSVGMGVLILLFSWLFLNILLGLVGFNIKFYGKWYDLPL